MLFAASDLIAIASHTIHGVSKRGCLLKSPVQLPNEKNAHFEGDNLNWLKEIDRRMSDFSHEQHSPNLSIKTLKNDAATTDISLIAQFFLTTTAMHYSNALVHIPTPPEVRETAINEVACHFAKIQYLYREKELFKIQMQNLLPGTECQLKKLHAENRLHPIVKDLFGTPYSSDSHAHNLTKTYQIDCRKIEPFGDEAFDAVWEFIKSSFLKAEGSLTISPASWKMVDELANSTALRYFATKCSSMYLIVDDVTKAVKALLIA
ncbi:hypothetical protein [Cohnella fermenti]|uniref:Uncharacterized protein n=1 Tax=Cohnella fermenti TaxID=2565925 RepID=A0A4S4C3K6_9BACL|nr:hypothetical protein [Cohnella fermenti]THF81670.1 hypothetical protein E6C55_08040 [Cohnella fermenti]